MVGSASRMRTPSRYGQPASPWPLALLIASAVLCAAAGELILARHPRLAGLVALFAAIGILRLTAIARRDRSARFQLAGLLMDRAFDASILAPLAWIARGASSRIAVLALVGLAVSFLASYQRARGEALDYSGYEGTEYRAVRTFLLALGLLAGWVEPTLWAFLVVATAAAGVRTWNVVRQQRKSDRSRVPGPSVAPGS
jgi:hypothetical protein